MNQESAALSERHHQILGMIVELFLQSSQPVGSRTISKELSSQWSPATIRNAMADLEEQGWLSQPHLSAGRVPTTSALKHWIDHMMQPTVPTAQAERTLREALGAEGDPRQRLERLAQSLSLLCQSAGLALAPRMHQGRLQRAELVPVGPNRVLFLWVTQSGAVYHRDILLDSPVGGEVVANLERVLNAEYRGHTFEEVRLKIRTDLRDMKNRFDALLDRLLVQAPFSGEEIIVEGVQRVVAQPDFHDVSTLKGIYEAFADRMELMGLLDRVARAGGPIVLLNEETGLASTGLGVVAAPYGGGRPLGSIGVLGPTRMPYPVVVGLVQCASQLLSEAFAQRDEGG